MKPKFKVGDRIVDRGIQKFNRSRNPYGIVVKIATEDHKYFIDFDDDFKMMSRFFNDSTVQNLTKLEKALK